MTFFTEPLNRSEVARIVGCLAGVIAVQIAATALGASGMSLAIITGIACCVFGTLLYPVLQRRGL